MQTNNASVPFAIVSLWILGHQGNGFVCIRNRGCDKLIRKNPNFYIKRLSVASVFNNAHLRNFSTESSKQLS
jgi:hypothetical protein